MSQPLALARQIARGVVVLTAALGLTLAGRGSLHAAEMADRPLILVHYMPWFAAPPVASGWGWHWTMGAFDPRTARDGQPSIASHYHPLIGPYDSSDPAVIEYHLLLMKLAGIDGMVVDWYGRSDHLDYPQIHRNTSALMEAMPRFGLKLAICYEDQTLPRLVQAGKLAATDRLTHARSELSWLRAHWCNRPSYLALRGRPVLLSFGFDGLTDGEWESLLAPTDARTSWVYLSEHRRRKGASGAFDWPVPKEGLASLDRYAAASRDWPVRMPAAFPRFHDIYAEAKVHASYGRIPDDSGRTFATTLGRALNSGAPMVQIVTWNDWGEGTMIEPSVEFGTRDLERIQRVRRERIDPAFSATAADLRLPLDLYRLRKQPVAPRGLDEIASQLGAGRLSEARAILKRLQAGSTASP